MGTCMSVSASAVVESSQAIPNAISELVSRAKEGDREAFANLYELYNKKVFSICVRMTGNVADAEDLTQEAFMQVFRKLASFRGDSLFSTWLCRVAVNTILMKLRQKHFREVSLDEPLATDSPHPLRELRHDDLSLLGAVDRIALASALQELPPGCRMIFLLHEVEGYEHREIAKMLRCSAGNSKSQLHKARWKMRGLLFPNHESISREAKSAKVQAA